MACPRCGSADILHRLPIHDSTTRSPFVEIAEPEPPNRPFVWKPETVRSALTVTVCGGCGYAELHASSHAALAEGLRRGFVPS